MSRRLTHLLVPCAVFLAACADSVISPESEDELTRDDTQASPTRRRARCLTTSPLFGQKPSSAAVRAMTEAR